MKAVQQIFTEIARRHLFIPTLQCQRSDSLDFHNVSVWGVQAALNAAFLEGVESAAKSHQPHGPAANERRHPSAVSPNPLIIAKGTPLVPGKMYLRLYHGRNNPDQEMDDWGFAGPTFGPLSSYVHTYCCTFRMHAESDTQEVWLETHDDMILWEDCYFGDMEVFIAGPEDKA